MEPQTLESAGTNTAGPLGMANSTTHCHKVPAGKNAVGPPLMANSTTHCHKVPAGKNTVGPPLMANSTTHCHKVPAGRNAAGPPCKANSTTHHHEVPAGRNAAGPQCMANTAQRSATKCQLEQNRPHQDWHYKSQWLLLPPKTNTAILLISTIVFYEMQLCVQSCFIQLCICLTT